MIVTDVEQGGSIVSGTSIAIVQRQQSQTTAISIGVIGPDGDVLQLTANANKWTAKD